MNAPKVGQCRSKNLQFQSVVELEGQLQKDPMVVKRKGQMPEMLLKKGEEGLQMP